MACAFWVLGFDVVPLAHMAFHDALDDHHHGVPSQQAHAHDHDHHSADEHAPFGEPRSSHPAGDESTPPEHGDGSVAHRDLAAHVAFPAIPTVQEALLAWSTARVDLQDKRPTSRRPQRTRARAPPCVTA